MKNEKKNRFHEPTGLQILMPYQKPGGMGGPIDTTLPKCQNAEKLYNVEEVSRK